MLVCIFEHILYQDIKRFVITQWLEHYIFSMYCVTQYKHSVRRILGYIDIFSALFIICLNVFSEHCSHLRNTVIFNGLDLCYVFKQAEGTHVLLLTTHRKQI